MLSVKSEKLWFFKGNQSAFEMKELSAAETGSKPLYGGLSEMKTFLEHRVWRGLGL